MAAIGDLDTMTQKAKALLTNDDLHAQFKMQAKDQASLFSIEAVVGNYENIYADAIASIQF